MRKKQLSLTRQKHTADIMEEFLLSCKVRNLSEHTIAHYERHLKMFFDYCGDIPASDLTKDLYEGYIHCCQEKGIKDVTVQTYVKVIRTFYYFCMEKAYIPAFSLSVPKAEKELKEVYTDEELLALLKKPDMKKANFAEYRMWVIINYVLATGNRIHTLINLKIKDLDFENAVIKLSVTKNRKQQIIPMTQSLVAVLKEYLSIRGGSPEDYLFCNRFGEQMTKTCICNYLWNYNHRRGVTKTSIHLFRHTFAKNYLKAGGDVFRLQKLMGHSNINVTKDYLNLLVDDLKDRYDELNPLEQIEKKKKKYISLQK